MNWVAVMAAASSNRENGSINQKEPSISKNAFALDKNKKKSFLCLTITTSRPHYPVAICQSSRTMCQNLSTQHLFQANAYPMRTTEAFYASKRVIEVQLFSMEHRWRLWWISCKTSRMILSCTISLTGHFGWICSKRQPSVMKWAFWILCFASLMRSANDARLRV